MFSFTKSPDEGGSSLNTNKAFGTAKTSVKRYLVAYVTTARARFGILLVKISSRSQHPVHLIGNGEYLRVVRMLAGFNAFVVYWRVGGENEFP